MSVTVKDDADLEAPVWGTQAISEIIRKSRKATEHLLLQRRIPADKCGRQWVSNRRRLLTIGSGKKDARAEKETSTS